MILESKWFGLSITDVDDDVRAGDGVECWFDNLVEDDDNNRRYLADSTDELGVGGSTVAAAADYDDGGGWCRRYVRDRWCVTWLLSFDFTVFVHELKIFVRFQSSTDDADIE